MSIPNQNFKKKNILQVIMFQDVIMDFKISKEKKISLFFSMSFGSLCPLKNNWMFSTFQKKGNGLGEDPF
jgi:hypothetical protein